MPAPYRSPDSYTIGTPDYNRWLNYELDNEFLGAEYGGPPMPFGGGGPVIQEPIAMGGGGGIVLPISPATPVTPAAAAPVVTTPNANATQSLPSLSPSVDQGTTIDPTTAAMIIGGLFIIGLVLSRK